MKEQTVCFTGHRLIPTEQYDQIESDLTEAITTLIQKGYRFFAAGGALGFDMMAAAAVLKLKGQFPHIHLILILPFVSQASGWSKHDQVVYEQIKAQASQIVYTAQKYFRGCLHKRNRHLVDASSVCICYLTKATGGTAYTVHYALKRGLAVVNIAKTTEC